MMLCGADTAGGFSSSGLWEEAHLRRILGDEHGVVVIVRYSLQLLNTLTYETEVMGAQDIPSLVWGRPHTAGQLLELWC